MKSVLCITHQTAVRRRFTAIDKKNAFFDSISFHPEAFLSDSFCISKSMINLSFDDAKIGVYFGTISMKNRMFRYLFSPL